MKDVHIREGLVVYLPGESWGTPFKVKEPRFHLSHPSREGSPSGPVHSEAVILYFSGTV